MRCPTLVHICLLPFAFCLCVASAVADDAPLRLLPAEFTLGGVEARQTLILETFDDQNATGQITAGVELSSSDPAIVKIENGVAVPVAV